MTHLSIGSLFSGYGGLDMAVETVFPGARPAWFCEYDDAPSRILDTHWPNVRNYRDVTTINWATMPPVGILTGGYPCQPFSGAGQRKGTDDERHLWPYVREAIRVLRPRYVVLENVAGHRSLGFDRVLGDMAEDGMRVWWTSVRASDVGAPHHRERLFIVATPADAASIGSGEHFQPLLRGVPATVGGGGANLAADADGVRGQDRRHGGGVVTQLARPGGSHLPLPNPYGIGRDRRRAASQQASRPHSATDRHSAGIEWGAYAPAVRRWERLTRPAPAPTEIGTRGKPRLNAAFAEWMMGLPAGHVTGVGLPRTAQLKAIGNGVCPPQAAAALRSLLELEAVPA